MVALRRWRPAADKIGIGFSFLVSRDGEDEMGLDFQN